jgi:tetratricopeptide (TPR) repeat protein
VSVSRPPLPDSYEGLLAQAQNLWQAGDIEGTITLYRSLAEKLGRLSTKILERRPELGDMRKQILQVLALLLRQEGRYAEATEVQQTLLQIDPENANVRRRDLATLRIAGGKVEAGLAELHALTEENPDDLWNWLTLGGEARIEGRFAESQAALDRALEVGSAGKPEDLAQVHYQYFTLFKEMGRLDDAVAAWERAVAQDPDAGKAVRSVYTMLTDAGRYSEAQRYIARDDNALQAGFQRGLIASLTGTPAEAKREWRRVAELDPTGFEYGHDAWAEAVLRLGDPIPALERLQELLSQHGSTRLLILSGIAWAMHGDLELAQKLFEQSISLLRRGRPAKEKLDSADWRLLDLLVADDELKSKLKPYFAVVETVWG